MMTASKALPWLAFMVRHGPHRGQNLSEDSLVKSPPLPPDEG